MGAHIDDPLPSPGANKRRLRLLETVAGRRTLETMTRATTAQEGISNVYQDDEAR